MSWTTTGAKTRQYVSIFRLFVKVLINDRSKQEFSLLAPSTHSYRDPKSWNNKRLPGQHSFSCTWPWANWLLIKTFLGRQKSEDFSFTKMPSPLSSGWLWPLSGGKKISNMKFSALSKIYLWQCEVAEAQTEEFREKRVSQSLSQSLIGSLMR